MPPSLDDDRATLASATRDLVALARQGELASTWCREADATALLATLRAGRSVLLVGPEGVGRRSTLRAAAALSAAARPAERVGLFSTSTGTLLAGTKYLGEWQTRLDGLLDALARRSWVLALDDVWNLHFAGGATDLPYNMLDHLRPWLADGRVQLVAHATPAQLRMLERTPGVTELFVHQAVEALDDAQVDRVLAAAAAEVELELEPAARASLVDLTRRFLPSRPQPGPALDLLQRVRHYQEQKAGIDEPEAATPAFVERVFGIYAGLPAFVVSRSTTRSTQEIRSWFEERLVGQREAIESVVQAIALFKSGLHDPRRPLGTFLFVGPTGVGKTELARALATFLFGSPHRMLRFDLGELKDESGVHRLLGSPYRPREPALLADAVRQQPFQVVLFDELEKAHPAVLDVLLSVLDEGRATTPSGDTVDLRSCFVLCTSNVGAQDASRAVGFGAAEPGRHRADLLAALEKTFRPELLGRFQHVVPFHPLDVEQVRRIARIALREILGREGITSRNLVVEVDDEALDLVISSAFDARWGARGLARELQRLVVMPLAVTLMEHRIEPGQVLKVTAQDGHVRVRRLDTATTHEARREAEPIPFDGRRAARPDLEEAARALDHDLAALSTAAGEGSLLVTRRLLESRRTRAGFWDDTEGAARELRDLDAVTRTLERLDRLRTRIADLHADLERSSLRSQLVGIAARAEELREAMATAWRELVHVGPDGMWDALVHVRPLGRTRLARDLLVRSYTAWAEQQGLRVDWLCEPRADDEAAWFAVCGPYAHGLLRLEAGVHRVADGEAHDAARVRVAPWIDRTRPVVFVDHRALKGLGAYGGKIRSRLACEGGWVLQNHRTLSENRDLALHVAAAWAEAPEPVDLVVRRYDLVAPLVRDALTGHTSGRPDALGPERLHELLCRRVEVASSGPEAA
ncbi:MAG: AAA family ATPase [Alphaproteobacteria bacterium]|nr:AAA family ATPase [Alphaproteobacteria bacterium]